jgi:hypothetical protein
MVRNTLIRYKDARLEMFGAPALMACLVRDFAEQFSKDNPQFNRDKFNKGLKED